MMHGSTNIKLDILHFAISGLSPKWIHTNLWLYVPSLPKFLKMRLPTIMELLFQWNFMLLKLRRCILWSAGLWHHVIYWVVTNTCGTCSLHLVLHTDYAAFYKYVLIWQAATKWKNKLLRFEFSQWLVFRLFLCWQHVVLQVDTKDSRKHHFHHQGES